MTVKEKEPANSTVLLLEGTTLGEVNYSKDVGTNVPHFSKFPQKPDTLLGVTQTLSSLFHISQLKVGTSMIIPALQIMEIKMNWSTSHRYK